MRIFLIAKLKYLRTFFWGHISILQTLNACGQKMKHFKNLKVSTVLYNEPSGEKVSLTRYSTFLTHS